MIPVFARTDNTWVFIQSKGDLSLVRESCSFQNDLRAQLGRHSFSPSMSIILFDIGNLVLRETLNKSIADKIC